MTEPVDPLALRAGRSHSLADARSCLPLAHGQLLGVRDDAAGDVGAGGALDALEPGRRVDLDDARAFFGFQHVDAGDAEAHDARSVERGADVIGRQLDALAVAAAMQVAAEFALLRRAPHGRD